MSVTADILRRLGKLRLAPEALEEVLEIIADIQSVDEDRKAKQRERTAKHRALRRDGNVTVTSLQRDPPPKIYNSTPHHDSPSDPDGSAAPKPRKARNRALPTDWQPGERSDRVRAELGRSTEWMNSTATDMRVWAESKGEVRSDWDATHDGWMRREAKRECERPPNGRAPPRGPSPGRRSTNGPLSLLASLNRADHDPPGSFHDDRTLDHDPSDGRSGRAVHEPDGGSPGGAWPEGRLRLLRAG
ncbi:hypothetical protein [Methylobacterium brachiatum]